MRRRRQARCLSDCTVDICNGPTGPADDVMVVVTDARLVQRHRSGRLDPPDQPGVGESVQHVVDRLPRHPRQNSPHSIEDSLGGCVWACMHNLEHRDSGTSHAKLSVTQLGCIIRRRRHLSTIAQSSGLNPDFRENPRLRGFADRFVSAPNRTNGPGNHGRWTGG